MQSSVSPTPISRFSTTENPSVRKAVGSDPTFHRHAKSHSTAPSTRRQEEKVEEKTQPTGNKSRMESHFRHRGFSLSRRLPRFTSVPNHDWSREHTSRRILPRKSQRKSPNENLWRLSCIEMYCTKRVYVYVYVCVSGYVYGNAERLWAHPESPPGRFALENFNFCSPTTWTVRLGFGWQAIAHISNKFNSVGQCKRLCHHR